MANVSTVTPANLIPTARTAAGPAASSTANPYDSGNITTWTLPGFPTQKLVNGTQSFSTQQGQVFTDFASGQIVAAPGTISGAPQSYSLQAGNPPQND
jgi:hypothetical protein